MRVVALTLSLVLLAPVIAEADAEQLLGDWTYARRSCLSGATVNRAMAEINGTISFTSSTMTHSSVSPQNCDVIVGPTEITIKADEVIPVAPKTHMEIVCLEGSSSSRDTYVDRFKYRIAGNELVVTQRPTVWDGSTCPVRDSVVYTYVRVR